MFTEFLNSYTYKTPPSELHSSMEEYRKNMTVEVKEVNFDELQAWSFDVSGDLVHESGKFFRICAGCAVDSLSGSERVQPVIDQPEQGILGIISRCKDHKIEILLQAKIEPGNLDSVQYSPTVQATKSNYTGAHKGRPVPYLGDFLPQADHVVSRGLQSEHGYKFYRKANDNVHVHDNRAKAIDKHFVWLSLGDIRYLLSREHCVNMDTRSVLATIDFIGKPLGYGEISSLLGELGTIERELLFSSVSDEGAVYSLNEIREWVARSKGSATIKKQILPLPTLLEKGWDLTKTKLSSDNNRHFELVGVRASIASRETSSWYQPIVRDRVPKVYAFLVKKINNILHVLVQAVEEDFSWSGPEVGPTIHSVPDSTFSLGESLRPFGLKEQDAKIIYDKHQSEEGGRFMEQKNRYIVAIVDTDAPVTVSEKFKWLTLYQIKQLTKQECHVNIEARTLTAIASYYKGKE